MDNQTKAAYFNQQGCELYTAQQTQEALLYFQEALELNPSLWEANCNLGHCWARLDDFVQASFYYHRVLQSMPQHAVVHLNLGLIYFQKTQYSLAISHLLQSLKADPKQPLVSLKLAEAYHNYAVELLKARQHIDALHNFEKSLQHEPNNDTARHMVHALTGVTPETAPLFYVQNLFDGYAQHYTEHVTQSLCYQVPTILREMFDNLGLSALSYRVLDLGCGTGLALQAFKDLSSFAIGVDVSANMLLEAKATGLYDKLWHQDILSGLEQAQQLLTPWSLILAADVFPYFGDLKDVFKNTAKALQAGGYFIFTIEQGRDLSFNLEKSGRFTHPALYVSTLLQEHGFIIKQDRDLILRNQDHQAVLGQVFIAKKL